jgi:hypothetical protein
LAFRQNGSLASANIGLAVGFRILRQRRARGVQHHSLGPFMIRVDPDVNLLIERNVRWGSIGGNTSLWQECREKKTSTTRNIEDRHDQASTPMRDCSSRRQASLKSLWIHLVDGRQVDEGNVRGRWFQDQPSRLWPFQSRHRSRIFIRAMERRGRRFETSDLSLTGRRRTALIFFNEVLVELFTLTWPAVNGGRGPWRYRRVTQPVIIDFEATQADLPKTTQIAGMLNNIHFAGLLMLGDFSDLPRSQKKLSVSPDLLP